MWLKIGRALPIRAMLSHGTVDDRQQVMSPSRAEALGAEQAGEAQPRLPNGIAQAETARAQGHLSIQGMDDRSVASVNPGQSLGLFTVSGQTSGQVTTPGQPLVLGTMLGLQRGQEIGQGPPSMPGTALGQQSVHEAMMVGQSMPGTALGQQSVHEAMMVGQSMPGTALGQQSAQEAMMVGQSMPGTALGQQSVQEAMMVGPSMPETARGQQSVHETRMVGHRRRTVVACDDCSSTSVSALATWHSRTPYATGVNIRGYMDATTWRVLSQKDKLTGGAAIWLEDPTTVAGWVTGPTSWITTLALRCSKQGACSYREQSESPSLYGILRLSAPGCGSGRGSTATCRCDGSTPAREKALRGGVGSGKEAQAGTRES